MDSSILSKLRFSAGIKSAIARTGDIAKSMLDQPHWIIVFVLSKLEINK